MKKEIIVILLLLVVSFPAVKALLQPGGYTSHDLTHHVVRQISMDKLLSENQLPPRWSADLNNGFGYPLFLFNYPLPALVGELFHKLGFGFVDSVKAVLLLSFLGSALGMYLFLKVLLKDQLAAFLGSIFYLYAPIRFLTVYVSAALGSAVGLGLIPWVFWAIVSGQALLGSLLIAALVLSHNVTTLIFLPFIGIVGLIGGNYKKLLVSLALGLGLSAFFWLPALVEKQYTKYDLVMGEFYKDHFPTLWQLIDSPWGYGLSHPGEDQDALSFQIGKIHILVMLLLTAMLWHFRKIKEVKIVGGFSVVAFLIGVFLMLEVSLPFWDKLPLLKLVQFPARFLSLAVFAASIAAALLIKYLSLKKLLVGFLLFLVLAANRNHLNINQTFDPGEEYYLSLKSTGTSWAEHAPVWSQKVADETKSKLEFIKGGGEVKFLENKSAKVTAEVVVFESGQLRFNQFFFPGWNIKIDGNAAHLSYIKSNGLPLFDIEKGIHKVEAEFQNTKIRNLADGISLISVMIWLSLSFNLTKFFKSIILKVRRG